MFSRTNYAWYSTARDRNPLTLRLINTLYM